MRHLLGRSARALLGAVVVSSALLVSGCGGGGGGGGPYARVVIENVDPSFAITEVNFDFFDISLLPNRDVLLSVLPGESAGFDFTQFESENFFSVTVTWSDAQTTFIPLVIIIGSSGTFSYPVIHP